MDVCICYCSNFDVKARTDSVDYLNTNYKKSKNGKKTYPTKRNAYFIKQQL